MNEINKNEAVVESKDIFAKQDENLDIMNLLKAAKDNPSNENKKSELQKMQEQKKGLIINNDEYEKDGEVKPLKQESETPERIKDFNDQMKAMDKMIDVAKTVNVTVPETKMDLAMTMMAISDMAEGKEIDGEIKQYSETHIREKTSNDVMDNHNRTKTNDTTNNINRGDDIEKQELVNIIIDKTGFGMNIDFTEEEKAKLIHSRQIKVTEIENMELSTITFKKPDKSFLETINVHTVSTTMTPVVFPASGIGASMAGLSFGELGDIGLDKETLTFSKLNKKYSIIYNKLKNSTIGKFKDYEDFLKKFAYTDLDIAVFGMACSTFPEMDTISLKCQHPKCQKVFEHTYSPRSIIKIDEMSKTMLKAMKNISNAISVQEYNELAENSPVRKYKAITLPHSRYIIEVGIASAYDYLHKIMDNFLDNKFEKNHPDDLNGVLQLNTTFISLIRSISVPVGPVYYKYEESEDIINVLYTIAPDEIAILTNLLNKYLTAYQVTFALVDVKCPHCGTVTKRLPIDINDLVFMKYQTLGNTTVDLENMLDL